MRAGECKTAQEETMGLLGGGLGLARVSRRLLTAQGRSLRPDPTKARAPSASTAASLRFVQHRMR